MTEEHKQNIVEQSLMAQGDSLYLAGPAARTDLSNRLTWNQRICPTSVRDFAVAQLSKLQQKLNEDNRAYLDRAETLYMDSQDPESNPDPNTDSNFLQMVTNGIREANIRKVVRDK